MPRRLSGLIILASCALLMAPAGTGVLTPLAGPGAAPPPPWHVAGLPLQHKPFTRFEMVDLDGRRVLKVTADESYGNLVHPLPPGTKARTLSWRWRVDTPVDDADLRKRAGDDTAIKVCANFDLPLEAVPFVERQVLKLARTQSEEPLPAASVCYVWDRHWPADSAFDNAFTRRLRAIVLRGQGAALREWTTERRDIVADFQRLFGGEAKALPPLIGITISADTDNTHGHSVAYVSDLVLE